MLRCRQTGLQTSENPVIVNDFQNLHITEIGLQLFIPLTSPDLNEGHTFKTLHKERNVQHLYNSLTKIGLWSEKKTSSIEISAKCTVVMKQVLITFVDDTTD